MQRALRTAAVLAAALAIVAASGCGGSGESEENEGQTAMIAGVEANDHGTKEVGDEAAVELDDFYFEPTVIKGEPGSQVKLELENESGTEHNFSIDSQSIDQDVEGGEDATVTVTIPQSGQLSFYCKYHKGQGMAGALEASG